MTNNGMTIIHDTIAIIWQLFTHWRIPGTLVTPAMAFLGFQFVAVVLKFLFRLLHVTEYQTDVKSQPTNTTSLTVRK